MSFPRVGRLRTFDLNPGCLFPGDLFLRSPEMLSAFSSLFLYLGFSFLGQPYFSEARKVNITVDDTDSLIVYEPTTAWSFSGNASDCAVCLTPPLSAAYNNTWHQGLRIPPTPSVNNTDSAGRKRSDDTSADGASKRRNDLSGERRAVPDPSRDVPVSVQLNFTGSAIYLYSIIPLGKPPNADSTPTLVNLTFTFDSEPAGNFLHSGSATNHGFQPTVSVFSRGGLSNSTHSLLVNLGPNSVFLLDYYVVSSTDCLDSNPCPTHSQVSTTHANKLSTRSIAAAVGGSIAVLLMFVTCLECSINRRRRILARRPMRNRGRQVGTQSFHSDVSGNPPVLPSYFPRTLSNAPPPYVGPAVESSVATQSDLSSIETYHLKPLPFQSTPSHPAKGAISPFVTHDREPSDIPPPFSVVSPPSPPGHTSAVPRTAQQDPPRGRTEDTEPASLEVAPELTSVTAAILPSSRPTRTLRRSTSSDLPDIYSTTISSLPSAIEMRQLSAEY